VADKLNVEQPPYGEALEQDQAAQAAAEPPPPLLGIPDVATAIQESAGQGPPAEPLAALQAPLGPPAAPGAAPAPRFMGISGALQAPSLMRQPMRSRFEQDQQIGQLWQVIAENEGSRMTQMIASSLSGVD